MSRCCRNFGFGHIFIGDFFFLFPVSGLIAFYAFYAFLLFAVSRLVFCSVGSFFCTIAGTFCRFLTVGSFFSVGHVVGALSVVTGNAAILCRYIPSAAFYTVGDSGVAIFPKGNKGTQRRDTQQHRNAQQHCNPFILS